MKKFINQKLIACEGKKDEVKEVSSGTECGIRIKNFNEFKDGDILECYLVSENTK